MALTLQVAARLLELVVSLVVPGDHTLELAGPVARSLGLVAPSWEELVASAREELAAPSLEELVVPSWEELVAQA